MMEPNGGPGPPQQAPGIDPAAAALAVALLLGLIVGVVLGVFGTLLVERLA